MPRNRRGVARDEKVDDIVRVGAEILRERGYGGLSVQAVAESLGLARGAVYWYFASKDELFAASAAQAIIDALQDAPRSRGPSGRIEWAVERLAELQPIHTALQERARYSPAVDALLTQIQGDLRRRLRDVLQTEVEPSRLDGVTEAIFIHVQGTLSMRMTPAERRRHLRFLVHELLDRPGRPRSTGGC